MEEQVHSIPRRAAGNSIQPEVNSSSCRVDISSSEPPVASNAALSSESAGESSVVSWSWHSQRNTATRIRREPNDHGRGSEKHCHTVQRLSVSTVAQLRAFCESKAISTGSRESKHSLVQKVIRHVTRDRG